MAGNALNQFKNIDLHIQDSQQTPNRKNIEKSSSRHIIVKMLKDKEKILKAPRYKKTTIRLTAYFSS